MDSIKLLDPVAELLSMAGVPMGSGLSNMTALRFGFPFHLPRPVNVCEYCGGTRRQSRPEPEWITATAAAGANRLPWWSSDGNLLYSPFTRDDYSCIW
jgi:hypothetical protein